MRLPPISIAQVVPNDDYDDVDNYNNNDRYGDAYDDDEDDEENLYDQRRPPPLNPPKRRGNQDPPRNSQQTTTATSSAIQFRKSSSSAQRLQKAKINAATPSPQALGSSDINSFEAPFSMNSNLIQEDYENKDQKELTPLHNKDFSSRADPDSATAIGAPSASVTPTMTPMPTPTGQQHAPSQNKNTPSYNNINEKQQNNSHSTSNKQLLYSRFPAPAFEKQAYMSPLYSTRNMQDGDQFRSANEESFSNTIDGSMQQLQQIPFFQQRNPNQQQQQLPPPPSIAPPISKINNNNSVKESTTSTAVFGSKTQSPLQITSQSRNAKFRRSQVFAKQSIPLNNNDDSSITNVGGQLLPGANFSQTDIMLASCSPQHTTQHREKFIRESNRKPSEMRSSIVNMNERRSTMISQPNQQAQQARKSKISWLFLTKLNKTKTFIQKLKQSSTYVSGFNSVNLKHLELIADHTDYKTQELRKLEFNWFSEMAFSLISHIRIFSPDSLIVICWNFLLSFCILIQFVMIPLKICFELQFEDQAVESVFYYFPAFVFVIELFIRLNISYYQEGVLINERKKILNHYFIETYYFWVDLITTLTFLLSKDVNHPVLIVIVIFRVLQFLTLINEIDEHFQISQRFPSAWNLSKLFLLIILVAHFTGCGFHYIASSQSESGAYTWLNAAKIYGSAWPERYIYSIYWSSITMITVGYGDIVPLTSLEKIYVIVMTLISAGVFAYSVNTIGNIFTEYSLKMDTLKTKKHDISTYMRTRKINHPLQIEVIKYIDSINQEEMEATKKGQEVITMLSDSIKEKLHGDYFGGILKQSLLFCNYSQPFLQEVALIMKEKLYGPGEMVFAAGDQDTRLIFIVKGQLQLFIPKSKKIDQITIATLDKGEVGHNGFFADQPRDSNLRSLNVSHTAQIIKEDFLNILQRFPADYERFCLMKDSIQQSIVQQKQTCLACDAKGHSIMTCQRIHLKLNKLLTILRFNHSCLQERVAQHRGNLLKWNALHQRQFTRESLIRLRGSTVAAISNQIFQQEDQEWLGQRRDREMLSLIPRIAYENDEYILLSESGSEQSSFTEDDDEYDEYEEYEDNQHIETSNNYIQSANQHSDSEEDDRTDDITTKSADKKKTTSDSQPANKFQSKHSPKQKSDPQLDKHTELIVRKNSKSSDKQSKRIKLIKHTSEPQVQQQQKNSEPITNFPVSSSTQFENSHYLSQNYTIPSLEQSHQQEQQQQQQQQQLPPQQQQQSGISDEGTDSKSPWKFNNLELSSLEEEKDSNDEEMSLPTVQINDDFVQVDSQNMDQKTMHYLADTALDLPSPIIANNTSAKQLGQPLSFSQQAIQLESKTSLPPNQSSQPNIPTVSSNTTPAAAAVFPTRKIANKFAKRPNKLSIVQPPTEEESDHLTEWSNQFNESPIKIQNRPGTLLLRQPSSSDQSFSADAESLINHQTGSQQQLLNHEQYQQLQHQQQQQQQHHHNSNTKPIHQSNSTNKANHHQQAETTTAATTTTTEKQREIPITKFSQLKTKEDELLLPIHSQNDTKQRNFLSKEKQLQLLKKQGNSMKNVMIQRSDRFNLQQNSKRKSSLMVSPLTSDLTASDLKLAASHLPPSQVPAVIAAGLVAQSNANPNKHRASILGLPNLNLNLKEIKEKKEKNQPSEFNQQNTPFKRQTTPNALISPGTVTTTRVNGHRPAVASHEDLALAARAAEYAACYSLNNVQDDSVRMTDKIDSDLHAQRDQFSKITLDYLKNYDIYFPDYNCPSVLKSYAQQRIKRMQESFKRNKKGRLQKDLRKMTVLDNPNSANAMRSSSFFQSVANRVKDINHSTKLEQAMQNSSTNSRTKPSESRFASVSFAVTKFLGNSALSMTHNN